MPAPETSLTRPVERTGAGSGDRGGVLLVGVAVVVCAAGALGLCHPPSPARAPFSRASHGRRFQKTVEASQFQKGNLHAHSDVSDGDSSPEAVYLWYRDHGYNFIALTDHNTVSDVSAFSKLDRPDFRIISGEEITMSGDGRQVHVNALCTHETIDGGGFYTPRAALDHAVSEITKQGGVALINHPNFDFGLTADDVAGTRGASLLEVWSGHPYVWTLGKEGRPSHEQIWQVALDRGVDLAPAGVDDMHQLLPPTNDRKPASPGVAWVRVFAPSPDPKLVCDKLRSGDLYATNGAELRRLSVDGSTMRVWPEDPKAQVEFIGTGGAILASTTPDGSGSSAYTLTGSETYVRARITDERGKIAFTPAYRVAD